MKAVRFDRYGGLDMLYIAELPMPQPGRGEVLVEVKAAGINPGEAAIRTGALHDLFPATFPSGQGADLSGIVVGVGPLVTDFAVGDEVLGYSETRSSHASHATVPARQLIRKPEAMTWEAAGAFYVVASAAYAAVRASGSRAGETVAVSAASGGVGNLVVQLLVHHGVRVLGIASSSSAQILRDLGAEPVAHGDTLSDRLLAAAPRGIDAFIDLFGPEYVHLAVELGIPRDRIETIISFEAAAEVGARAEGSSVASTPEVLSEMAELVANGDLVFPIAGRYALEDVRDAFALLERRHSHGKIVLRPGALS